jgi:hypothetical protein
MSFSRMSPGPLWLLLVAFIPVAYILAAREDQHVLLSRFPTDTARRNRPGP